MDIIKGVPVSQGGTRPCGSYKEKGLPICSFHSGKMHRDSSHQCHICGVKAYREMELHQDWQV